MTSEHLCPGDRMRGCGHPAKLVVQHLSKVTPSLNKIGIKDPHVIRAYLCKWHLGWLNRYRLKAGKPKCQWKKHIPDEELLND